MSRVANMMAGNGIYLTERNVGSVPGTRVRVCFFRYCTHQQLLRVCPNAAVGGVNYNVCAAPASPCSHAFEHICDAA